MEVSDRLKVVSSCQNLIKVRNVTPLMTTNAIGVGITLKVDVPIEFSYRVFADVQYVFTYLNIGAKFFTITDWVPLSHIVRRMENIRLKSIVFYLFYFAFFYWTISRVRVCEKV